jgi:hypothetical protein
MTENNLKNIATELFQRISRLSSESEWTDDELRAALAAEGVDPSSLLIEVRSDVKRLLNASPHHWRNRARALRAELQRKLLVTQRKIKRTASREEVLNHIEASLARMPPALVQDFGFEYRNFSESSDEDLSSILIELEFIENLDPRDAEK